MLTQSGHPTGRPRIVEAAQESSRDLCACVSGTIFLAEQAGFDRLGRMGRLAAPNSLRNGLPERTNGGPAPPATLAFLR